MDREIMRDPPSALVPLVDRSVGCRTFDSAASEFPYQMFLALVVLYHLGAESHANVRFDGLQLAGIVCHPEVARPSSIPLVDLCHLGFPSRSS